MAEYSQVFIDYCREVMPIESFKIFMGFLGAEDEDVICSLLKGNSTMENSPAEGLERRQPVRKE